MFKALLFLAKVAIITAAVIWIADRPGTITIDWLSYKLTFSFGFFLLAMMVIVAVGIVIFSIIKTVLDAPKNIQRYKDMTHKDKGLKALTIGLTAVAAGDGKSAMYQAYRAARFLGEKDGLSNLLMAQALRLNGQEVKAAQNFSALLENQDASFLGLRGLLQTALDQGDLDGAREVGYRALELQPKQGWLLKIVYDLEIRLRHWDDSLKLLYRAEKCGAIPVAKANSDRVAMLLAQADIAQDAGDEVQLFRTLQKAYKYDPHFVPTVLRLSRMYIQRGKRKAALSMISKAWEHSPHPDFVVLWSELCPKGDGDEVLARIQWFEKLAAIKPDCTEGLLALAGVLIEADLWGDARQKLEKLEQLSFDVRLYKVWAKLEERATRDAVAVRRWLERAADAPREKVWICNYSGRIYDQWVPVSDQGLFNTIIWDYPLGRAGVALFAGYESVAHRAFLIEAKSS